MKPAPHRARKRFGQHFLADPGVIDAIIRSIAPKPGEAMVEIGPGLAALTQPLVERVGRLTVVELDRDLAARLRAHPHLRVVESDVLRVNFEVLHAELQSSFALSAGESGAAGLRLRLVGNLPYNISTPILFHLMAFAAQVEDQHFMLQKEVVERMVAAPSTAAYGRLSVMLQWRYAMEEVLQVAPEAFDPPPKVDSSVVRMQPRAGLPRLETALLEELVRIAFGQRRKLLRHQLGRWLDERGYAGSFDTQRRAEEVPVDEYVALAHALRSRT